MDEVFGDGGPENKQAGFKNKMIWRCGRMGAAHKMFATAHNSILFYTKTDQWYWDAPKVPYAGVAVKNA